MIWWCTTVDNCRHWSNWTRADRIALNHGASLNTCKSLCRTAQILLSLTHFLWYSLISSSVWPLISGQSLVSLFWTQHSTHNHILGYWVYEGIRKVRIVSVRRCRDPYVCDQDPASLAGPDAWPNRPMQSLGQTADDPTARKSYSW